MLFGGLRYRALTTVPVPLVSTTTPVRLVRARRSHPLLIVVEQPRSRASALSTSATPPR